MIFQRTWPLMVRENPPKWQSRRLVKPEHWEFQDGPNLDIQFVMYGTRMLWEIGRDYAIQPGRGKPAIRGVRFVITRIRKERLRDITEEDAIAEGVREWDPDGIGRTAREAFAALWNSIHTKPGTRWEDNPWVWVLEFKIVRFGDSFVN